MRNSFDDKLDRLNNLLIEMGTLIESSINITVEALLNQDIEHAKKTMNIEVEIDTKEDEIEDLCYNILLRQQPVARDLRIVSSALKMVTDMERIGDQAKDISEIIIHLCETNMSYKTDLINIQIQKMAEETKKMVTGSIDAFVAKNLELAHKIIESDDIVDGLFLTVRNDIIEFIKNNSANGNSKPEEAIDFLMIAKYFERIGDHSCNIAEWVVYSITGKHYNLTVGE